MYVARRIGSGLGKPGPDFFEGYATRSGSTKIMAPFKGPFLSAMMVVVVVKYSGLSGRNRQSKSGGGQNC
jgi:hypothetical protein